MEIKDFFHDNPNIAVAFSGGTDSSFLLYCAQKYGKACKAYYVKSAFQPEFEMIDAKKIAEFLHVNMKIIHADILSDDNIAGNPRNRCYYCKKKIMSLIRNEAQKDGFDVIVDGTNISDSVEDRPGMKALSELNIMSPLRQCELTKEMIREKSKSAGLFTWEKSAYACLATRISTGEKITEEKLNAIEMAEKYLYSLGFRDFRVRISGDNAKIQITSDMFPLIIENRIQINRELKKYYGSVLLDLEERNG